MKRRDTLKVLGSIPFLAFGGASFIGCNQETTKDKSFKAIPKNIVLVVADGMGVAQWQAGAIANGGKLNVGRMTHGGLMTTNPCDTFCGDAPSHCTALACGVNSHKGAVGVDKDDKPVKNIIYSRVERLVGNWVKFCYGQKHSLQGKEKFIFRTVSFSNLPIYCA